MHFLAVHETQLAVYEATKLERVKQVSLSTCIIFNSYMMLTANVELVISCGLDMKLFVLYGFSGPLEIFAQGFCMLHYHVTTSLFML